MHDDTARPYNRTLNPGGPGPAQRKPDEGHKDEEMPRVRFPVPSNTRAGGLNVYVSGVGPLRPSCESTVPLMEENRCESNECEYVRVPISGGV